MGSILDILWARERRPLSFGGWPILGFLLMALALLVIPYRLAASEAQARGDQLRAEITDIRRKNERLAGENERLRHEVAALKEPRNLVKVARDDLGMVRPGEIVFFVAH